MSLIPGIPRPPKPPKPEPPAPGDIVINCTVTGTVTAPPKIVVEVTNHEFVAQPDPLAAGRWVFTIPGVEPPNGYWYHVGLRSFRAVDPLPRSGSHEGPRLDYARQPPPKRVGLVSLAGRAWLLDGVPWYPLVSSLLWGLGGAMKGGAERERVGRNAQWMAARGVDATRAIYEVEWTKQPYGGLIRGSSSALADYLDWQWEDFGLRTKITAQAGAPSSRIGVIGDEILRAVESRKHTVLMLESTNEMYAAHTDAIALAKILMQSGLPTSVGWGTAGLAKRDDGLPNVREIGDEAGTSVDTIHLERTPPTGRRDRQCYDFSKLRRASDNGEFAGPGSSVASEESAFHMAVQRIGGILMGAGNYCIHTGDMVYGIGYQGPTGPRYANAWERPGIEAIYAAVRNVDNVIDHTGVENWTHTNNPIPVEVSSGQVDKQYFALSDAGDALALLTETSGVLSFKENKPMAWYALYNPVTGAEVPERSGLPAYLLKGHLK